MRTLAAVDLGRQPYQAVLDYQRAVRLARISGAQAEDVVLFVEHEPVFTFGRGTQRTSLPLSEDALRARGADVVEIERGGDVTWHGPGQLVAYPILNLTAYRQDLHWYLRAVEEVVIGTLEQFEVAGERNPGKTGVWTNGRKIASIGIHVKQWVTLHGFALNLDPDLAWFDLIVPCGIHGVSMTSVARERPDVPTPDRSETIRAAMRAFEPVLDVKTAWRQPRELAVDPAAFLHQGAGSATLRPLQHLP